MQSQKGVLNIVLVLHTMIQLDGIGWISRWVEVQTLTVPKKSDIAVLQLHMVTERAVDEANTASKLFKYSTVIPKYREVSGTGSNQKSLPANISCMELEQATNFVQAGGGDETKYCVILC